MCHVVADMVLADMIVADIDFPCGRYGFLLWPISSCCGRYGLWPIWSHPGTHKDRVTLIQLGDDQCSDQCQQAVLRERPSHATDLAQCCKTL